MNILFISKQGNSLSLAKRIETEGHNPLFYIFDKNYSKVGDNLITKPNLKQPLQSINGKCFKNTTNQLLKETQPDLVVFDDVGLGDVADYIHSLGINLVGASRWADFAELDRAYGIKLLRAIGIPQPLTKTFSCLEYDKAVKYTQSNNKSYLTKLIGTDIVIQDNDGVNITVGFFWNGLNSSLHYFVIEDYEGSVKLGEVAGFVTSKAKLIKNSIDKMERLLKKVTYKGQVSIKCLVTEKEIYGLGLIVHLDIAVLSELYRGQLADLLFGLATGSDRTGMIYGDLALGVGITVNPDTQKDLPILGVAKENLKHIWFRDVKLNTDYYETAGLNLGLITARGKDIRECQRRAYRTIDNLTIPYLDYSKSAGNNINNYLRRVKGWGWF